MGALFAVKTDASLTTIQCSPSRDSLQVSYWAGPCAEIDLLDRRLMSLIVPCGILEQAGLQGVVAADQCEFLPNLINETCGCVTAPSAPSIPSAPSQSPVPQNDPVLEFFFCEVCGEGRVIGATPGATVSIPGEEDQICYEVAEDGAAGRIDRERCEKIKPYVELSCGCQATNPPCLVCGVGQTIIDANGVISFPGMREFHATGGYCRYV